MLGLVDGLKARAAGVSAARQRPCRLLLRRRRAARCDGRLPAAQTIVELTGFPGDLVRLLDQDLHIPLEDFKRSNFRVFVLLKGALWHRHKTVDRARLDQAPVILADLDVAVVQDKLTDPAPIVGRCQDEVVGI
jgi:hypothetical protein